MEIFGPVSFSPSSPLKSAGEFKTGQIPCLQLSVLRHNCVWVNSWQGKNFWKGRRTWILKEKKKPVYIQYCNTNYPWLTLNCTGTLTVTWAFLHVLPWFPLRFQIGFPKMAWVWVYRFREPILGPYILYQKVRQLPPGVGLTVGDLIWALSFWRLLEASV